MSRKEKATRRVFLRASVATVASIGVPAFVHARSPNEKLNIGIIGAMGRGLANTRAVESENIAAFCDVDEHHLEQAAARHPKARKWVDFRRMLEARRDLDAVVISTTAHTHVYPTLLALDLGLHVYCEKPLAHTVYECRLVREAAARAGVATQMGIQIHASNNFRRVVELVRTGAVGEISEVHVWVARAWGDGGRPPGFYTVPGHLHWDLWLGPARYRNYHPIYHPRKGPGWYKFWDFGGGTLPDLGSHWNDLPFWALELDAPRTVEAFGPRPDPDTAPATMAVKYEFPASGSRPPVTLYWYQGMTRPSFYTGEIVLPDGFSNGILFVGSKGAILADYRRHVLLPEETYRDFVRPEPFIPDSPGHHAEWILACKNGTPTSADFAYSSRLTEMNQLGVVAYRLQKKLIWDASAMRVLNAPEAEALIVGYHRQGWELPRPASGTDSSIGRTGVPLDSSRAPGKTART